MKVHFLSNRPYFDVFWSIYGSYQTSLYQIMPNLAPDKDKVNTGIENEKDTIHPTSPAHNRNFHARASPPDAGCAPGKAAL